jgi:hypothetical protein
MLNSIIESNEAAMGFKWTAGSESLEGDRMEAAALSERVPREFAAAGIRFFSRLKRAMGYMQLPCPRIPCRLLFFKKTFKGRKK